MAEDWCPLVDEGVHTLFLPFGCERSLEQKTLVAQTFRKGSLERAIDCFLRTNMDGLAIGSFLALKTADSRRSQSEPASVAVGIA